MSLVGGEPLSLPWDRPTCAKATGEWDPAFKAAPPVPPGSQGAQVPPVIPSALLPVHIQRWAAWQHVPMTWRLRCPGLHLLDGLSIR